MQNYAVERERMIREQLQARGIKDPSILAAFRAVPRELFVPAEEQEYAYGDYPLPIGYGQTISQPYIVAYMLEVLAAVSGQRVLEIGMGSGYQTALLHTMGTQVFSVERLPMLACRAMRTLASIGIQVNVKIGDGTQGWSAEAPFDRVMVAAASPSIIESLFRQLSDEGIMVLPVGGILGQELVKVTRKRDSEKNVEYLTGCAFVPLVGKYGFSNG